MASGSTGQEPKPAGQRGNPWKVATFTLLLAIAVGAAVWFAPRNQGVLRDGQGVAPTTAEEKLVAKHLLDVADDPRSVEFVKWGPHRYMPDHMVFAKAKGTLPPPQNLPSFFYSWGWMVRVTGRKANAHGALERFDSIVILTKDNKVATIDGNLFGDEWADKMFPVK